MRRYFILFSLLGLVVLTGASCLSSNGGGSGPMGMYRSVDKGDTWQAINAFPSVKGVLSIAGVKVFRMYVDPSDPHALYLTSRGQGLFYSYDNGDSWQAVGAMAGKFLYGFAIDPKDKCTIYTADEQHIYKTIDCSRTWQVVYQEERNQERFVALAIDYKNSNLIYAAELGGDVLSSHDAGRSWQVVKRFGFNLQHLTTDPLTPDRVLVATYRNGLFISSDQGQDWTDLSDGFAEFSGSKEFYRLVLQPEKRDSIFWISKYGILHSTDAGATWQELKLITPPGSVNIYGFAINPTNPKEIYYTGTILGEKNTNIRSTFYGSSDGGENWVTKKLPSSAIPTQILISPENPSELFMGFTSLN